MYIDKHNEKIELKNLTEEELKDFMEKIGEKNSEDLRCFLGYTR